VITLERKSGSLSIWFFNSWHKVKRVFFWSCVSRRETNFTVTCLMFKSVVKIRWQEPATHSCSFWDLVNCVPTILVDLLSNFFDILVGTTCWRAPRMMMIFNAHFSSFEPRKPLENLCTAQCFLLKGLLKHFMCFCGCFSETETKSQADSLFGMVRHHDFTRGAWQHKPVQPSTAMSAWLLTCEGCNYTHLAGEHSTTIRKSSPKPVWFFWVPPRMC